MTTRNQPGSSHAYVDPDVMYTPSFRRRDKSTSSVISVSFTIAPSLIHTKSAAFECAYGIPLVLQKPVTNW
jgi:hypothetical protein